MALRDYRGTFHPDDPDKVGKGLPEGALLLSHIAPVYVVNNKACMEKDCYACAIITWSEEEAEIEASNIEDGLVMLIEPKKG